MAFPNSLECKFSSIKRLGGSTEVKARVYKTSDGGIDDEGQQIYNRILVGTFTSSELAGITNQSIVQKYITKLSTVNTLNNLGYSANRFICSLP